MAVVPNSRQTYSVQEAMTRSVSVRYVGPAIVNDPPTNPPSYFCKSFGTFVEECTRPHYYLLDRVTGSKNVPYVPSRDNQIPLSYERLNWHWSKPILRTQGLVIQHDFAGFPLNCPTRTLEPNMFLGSAGYSASMMPVTQQLINHATARANGRIANQKNITVNWANFVGEQRDARVMIYRNLDDLVKTVRFLRKGKFERAYSQLFGSRKRETYDPLHQKWRYSGKRDKRSASSLWLEWHWGWVPLVTDVYSGLKDMRASTAPLILTARGHSTDHDEAILSHTSTFGIGASVAVSHKVRVKRYVKYSVSLRYRVLNTLLSDLNSAGIVNPVETIWELTPFSHLADWFVNVGDYLRAATIGSGLQFLSGTSSTLQRYTVDTIGETSQIQGKVPTSFKVTGKGTVQYFDHRSEFKRTRLYSPPVVTLGLQKDPFSVTRIISAAALLKQLLGGWDRK